MDAVTGDTTVDQACSAIADAVLKAAAPHNVRTAGDAVYEQFSDKERKQYSLRNALAFAVNQRKAGTQAMRMADARKQVTPTFGSEWRRSLGLKPASAEAKPNTSHLVQQSRLHKQEEKSR
jgi:hypothetical protein